ncbi:MAG: outer membrane beta-barrel protein [Planctomycetes bacterium]|nr:outer membrane beta-barrel protein [Planctomycetota bacterium]
MRTLAVFLILAAPALAQGEPLPQEQEYQDYFGIGGKALKVTGGFKTEAWWDNNLTLAADNEIDDFYVALIPELQLRYDLDPYSASFKYRGRDQHFNDNNQFNGMEHFMDALVRYQAGMFWAEAGDEYKNRKEPLDPLQFPGRLDMLSNRGWVTGGADFNQIDLEVTAELTRQEIFDPVLDLGDFRRASISGLIAYDVMPKTQVFVEGLIAATEYDDDDILNSFTFFRAVVGVRGRPTAKLLVNLRAGFGLADPDDDALIPSDEIAGPVATGSITWFVTEVGTLKAELIHQPLESIFTGLVQITAFKVDYEHRYSERISFKAGAGVEQQIESEGEFDRLGVEAHAGSSYAVGRHFTLDAWLQFRAKRSDTDLAEYDNVRGYVGAAITW